MAPQQPYLAVSQIIRHNTDRKLIVSEDVDDVDNYNAIESSVMQIKEDSY